MNDNKLTPEEEEKITNEHAVQREEALISKREVLNEVSNSFEKIWRNIGTRPLDEQKAFGDFVTVLESEIKNGIKEIKTK